MFVYFLQLLHNIIMLNRKRTLPRHTVLAGQARRIGAFLADFIVFFVTTAVSLMFIFSYVFAPVVEPYVNEMNQEKLNTGLLTLVDGKVKEIEYNDTFEEFENRISYYYMNYLTGENLREGLGASKYKDELVNEKTKSEYYTVEWFNKYILNIGEDPDNDEDSLFTYVKVSEVYDKTVLGTTKPHIGDEVADADYDLAVSQHMQQAYINAYSDFFDQQYIIDLDNKSSFIYSVEFVLSGLFGAIVTYIVFPLIFKNGRTLGKKLFNLALANSEGYKFKTSSLFLRLIPLLVVLFSFLVPIWNQPFMVVLVPLVIIISSFAFMMASPKKMCLHDLVALTIVVDNKSSIIFDDSAHEEEYIFKEDGIEEKSDE